MSDKKKKEVVVAKLRELEKIFNEYYQVCNIPKVFYFLNKSRKFDINASNDQEEEEIIETVSENEEIIQPELFNEQFIKEEQDLVKKLLEDDDLNIPEKPKIKKKIITKPDQPKLF
jgi:hypothetical protein